MVQVQNSLPETSRVWVYQANRSFTAIEVEELKVTLNRFNLSWEAHGNNLNSAIEILL